MDVLVDNGAFPNRKPLVLAGVMLEGIYVEDIPEVEVLRNSSLPNPSKCCSVRCGQLPNARFARALLTQRMFRGNMTKPSRYLR